MASRRGVIVLSALLLGAADGLFAGPEEDAAIKEALKKEASKEGLKKIIEDGGLKDKDEDSLAEKARQKAACAKDPDACPKKTLEKLGPRDPVKDKARGLANGAAQPPGASPDGVAVGVSPGGGPAAPPPTAASATSHDSVSRQQRAMGSAVRSAENLRRSLQSGEALGAGAGPGAAQAAAAASPLAPRAPVSLADPKTPQDLVVAAHSGFSETFRSLGLKTGRGASGEAAVLRLDGRPATEGELDRLRERIAAEPAALMRRPDFFQVLPREKFDDLKAGYQAQAQVPQPAFKDVGMTEQNRDFQWSASCSRVSGGCNPVVQQNFYRRGEDVAPEALGRIWSALKPGADPQEPAEGEDSGLEEYTEEERAKSDAAQFAAEKLSHSSFSDSALSSIRGGIESMGAAVRGFFGGSLEEGVSAAAPAGPPAGAGPAAGAAPGKAYSARAPAGGRSASVRPLSPVPSAVPEGGARRGLLWLAVAAAAAVLLWTGLRRAPD